MSSARFETSAAQRRARRVAAAGFTLIELLLVLVILGVLAAIVVPKFAGRGEQARIQAANQDVHNIDSALDVFETDTGRYPNSDEGIQALMSQPNNVQNWHGPYLKTLPQDPWGHPYGYRFPGQHNANGPDVFSTGPDGQEGTPDDITNWTKSQ